RSKTSTDLSNKANCTFILELLHFYFGDDTNFPQFIKYLIGLTQKPRRPLRQPADQRAGIAHNQIV
ncbi:hypothetical protein COT78_02340, partial [Candidatus Berkelbacteria bacterium CG10_big_fil_rev_8_21_14_0_10_43_13]